MQLPAQKHNDKEWREQFYQGQVNSRGEGLTLFELQFFLPWFGLLFLAEILR